MMYRKMKEIPVTVELNDKGCPDKIIAEVNSGEYREIKVQSSCFYEALKSSYQSYFRACIQIYAYRYKVRICMDNQVKTYFLDHLLEDDSWGLKVEEESDYAQF